MILPPSPPKKKFLIIQTSSSAGSNQKNSLLVHIGSAFSIKARGPGVNCTNWKHQSSWIKLKVYAFENDTKLNRHLKSEKIQGGWKNWVVSPPKGQMGKMVEFVERMCVWGGRVWWAGGVVRLDSAGEATPKVESGSRRMKITTANVSSIY